MLKSRDIHQRLKDIKEFLLGQYKQREEIEKVICLFLQNPGTKNKDD